MKKRKKCGYGPNIYTKSGRGWVYVVVALVRLDGCLLDVVPCHVCVYVRVRACKYYVFGPSSLPLCIVLFCSNVAFSPRIPFFSLVFFPLFNGCVRIAFAQLAFALLLLLIWVQTRCNHLSVINGPIYGQNRKAVDDRNRSKKKKEKKSVMYALSM